VLGTKTDVPWLKINTQPFISSICDSSVHMCLLNHCLIPCDIGVNSLGFDKFMTEHYVKIQLYYHCIYFPNTSVLMCLDTSKTP